MTDFTDAELAAQPAGYWTGAAKTAIAGFINGRLGELGLSQPHWWTLYRVGESAGLTRDELLVLMRRTRPYVDAEDLWPAVDDLLAARRLSVDAAERLQLTESGATLRDQVRALVEKTLAQIHDGISDADYVLVVKVLRRMIANAGGDPTFHFH